jgi:hypothetical protein
MFGNPPDSRTKLMTFLKAEGLEYGYATYWNAGVNTVLSKGAVRVRQVTPKQGLLVPFRHASSNRWYRPEAWSGPTFLMLTDEEKRTLDWSRITAYAGNPTRELRYENVGIYVFPENLAAKLPFWGNDVTINLLDMGTAHTIGRKEALDNGQALISEQGERGFLHYGPYLALEPGRYRVNADLEAEVDDAGLIDVTAKSGQLVLASKPIGAVRWPVMEIEIPPGVTDLEVRVQSNGKSKLVLRRLTIQRISSVARLPAPSRIAAPQPAAERVGSGD